MLEERGLLHKAKGLDSIELAYPEQPFAVLHELHVRYPFSGPALSRDDLVQYDDDLRDWQAAIVKAEHRVTELSEKEGDLAGAEDARTEAEDLRAGPPRNFEQQMKRSQTFFHPDKREKDRGTSAEDKSAQFAQVNQAWSQLGAYRTRFQELRAYQASARASRALLANDATTA